MTSSGHRRQVLLFLVAIILPCVVLVVLGLRMLAQERELAEKRVADERRSVANQVRQELAAHLDRIALREVTALAAEPDRIESQTYGDVAVALVASVVDGTVLLPWERDPRPARFRRLLEQGEFARHLRRAERAELGSRNAGEAAALYGEALAAAVDPAQATYAQMLRGRSLMAAGRDRAASRDHRAVLEADLGIVDEHGVPLALYAAARLVDRAAERQAISRQIQAALGDPRWLSPTALYLLRDLSESLGRSGDGASGAAARILEATLSARVAHTEQAIGLQLGYPRLGLEVIGGQPIGVAVSRWISYGSPEWLVGVGTSLSGPGEVLVAVWADSVFRTAEAAVAEAGAVAGTIGISAGDGVGHQLGSSFPGLEVRFPPAAARAAAQGDARRWFVLVVLLLVVSVTLFGAYFVSRDVRRELRLAQMRSRFVSAVSHELKTPLTAIRMFAETLQLGRPENSETRAEYLETIVNESERLTRLLNNVLNFSKIERGEKVYRRESRCLGDIVRTSARAMRYPLAQERFTLHLDVADDMPPANVDADAIEQAILNLLANAVKYSGDSREIALRLERVDGKAVIEVEDHGVGIEPGEQSRIFERFYRVTGKDNEGIPGTGLGLTLVRHIAEAHGGTVTVDSAPGEGSTFAIHLPLGGEA